MPPETPDTARPRVLVVASTFPARDGDGTPSFVRDLSAEIAREYEVEILVPQTPGAPRVERVSGMLVRRFRYFPSRWEDVADGALLENVRASRARALTIPFLIAAEALAMKRAVRRFRPDVLHVYWLIPQGLVALVAGGRLPWLLTTLGGDLYALNDPISVRLKRRVVARAAEITAMNGEMVDKLKALGGDPAHLHVEPMSGDAEMVRSAAAGVAQIPGRISFVGRLVEKKGVSVLIDALQQLPAEATCSLSIVGDGPLRSELEAQAKGLPVHFLGQLSKEDAAREVAASQFLVAPGVRASTGDQDGLPVVVVEAMQLGRPVVTSDLPGASDLIVDGESGLIVRSGDAAGLAKAMERLLGDPERCAAFGERARDAAGHLTLPAAGARYRELIAKILGGAAPATARLPR